MLPKTFSERKLDPRIKRTRILINQAFIDLLEEKAFKSITVKDITQKAGINRATFYAHFPDKFALLEISIRETFQREMDKRTLNSCHYSHDNLRSLFVTVCEFLSQSTTKCKTPDSQFEMLVERQVRKQIQDLLEAWLLQADAGADMKIAATAASWTVYGLALQWSRDKNTQKPSAEIFAEQALPLITVNLGFNKTGKYVAAEI